MVSDVRLKNIKDAISYLSKNKIQGDVIECGVWKGGSVAFATRCLTELSDFRRVHLFDAFDDICEPDHKVDGQRAINDAGGLEFSQGKLQPIKGIYTRISKGTGPGNEAEVQNLITTQMGYPDNLVNIYKGYFQDVLPEVENQIGKVGLLRLDGDWYASTKVCLEFLFDKVVSGGVIIIDDYGAYDGCKTAVDEFLKGRNIFPWISSVDIECIFWIKL